MAARLSQFGIAFVPWIVAAMFVSSTYGTEGAAEAEKVEQNLKWRASPPPPPDPPDPPDSTIEPWEIVPV